MFNLNVFDGTYYSSIKVFSSNIATLTYTIYLVTACLVQVVVVKLLCCAAFSDE